MSKDDGFGLDERPLGMQVSELRGEVNGLKQRIATLEQRGHGIQSLVVGSPAPPGGVPETVTQPLYETTTLRPLDGEPPLVDFLGINVAPKESRNA